MNRRWAGFAIGIIAIGLCALIVANWKRFRPYEWRQVQSADAQFSISFPGNPTASQESNTASDGSKFVSSMLISSPANGVTYALSWWENSTQTNKSTDTLFADFRDCGIKAFHGKVVSEKELNVQGYPATDTVVLAANGAVVVNRVIRVGSRFYSLWVVYSLGHIDRANVRKFLGSLSIH
jgi:hypothetical protein